MENRKQILDALKGRGHRITKARSAIIDFFLQTKKPLTASYIYAELSRLGLALNRATVYRELVFLLENDIVRQLRLPGKATHYEVNSGHRHHLVCIKCNSVKDVVLGKHLEHHERRIYERERFKVVSHSLEFYGLCSNCNSKQTP